MNWLKFFSYGCKQCLKKIRWYNGFIETKKLNLKPIFDIRPVDETGRVDLAKIESVKAEINLRPSDRGSTFLKTKVEPQERSDLGREGDFEDGIPKALIPNLVFGVPMPNVPVPKLNGALNQTRLSSPAPCLTDQGPTFLETCPVTRRRRWFGIQGRTLETGMEIQGRPLKEKDRGPTFLQTKACLPARQVGPQRERKELILELEEELKKQEKIEAVLASVGGQLETAYQGSTSLGTGRGPAFLETQGRTSGREVQPFYRPRLNLKRANKIQGRTLAVGLLIALFVGGFFLFQKSLGLKQDLASKGGQAVKNLEQARSDAEKLDFISAADNFSFAYKNFSDASRRLNLLGNAFTSFLGAVPGFGKLKSAQNLIQAGENISKAGEILTSAAVGFYQTNPVFGLGFGSEDRKSLSEIITPFREALVSASGKIKTASQLLASVDESIIPEEQRQPFLDFRAQLPLLEEFAGEAADYADFLSELTGASGPKKYLLIFQNNSELRPTGGFFGSYALIDFNRGFLRNLAVDDVYNIDGQAKKNIIPPRELQHITPTWGMRDANWFVNFPDSARKVMEMYTENNGGPAVDGVIAITPSIITKILEVIGPVEMPEYGRNVDGDNFLAEIQEEVEYGENRVQPKTILVDFTPRFLEKLGQQDTEQWLKIFQILANGIEQKHLLAYFKNSKLEETVLKNGFGGEIKNTDGDFLMIAHSNIKGSKTDAVIDSSYELESRISEDGFVEHNLKIRRKHNGGKTKFGFYNRTNFDFVRVLVPEGSEVLDVRGDYKPDFKPLVDYGKIGGFVVDSDLEKYETCSYKAEPCTEGGKAVFGFWMKIEPGQEREVVLNYKTPMRISGGEYSLLVQKQPGTVDDEFSFNFELAENKTVTYKYPELAVDDNVVYFDTYLFKDLVVGFKFR